MGTVLAPLPAEVLSTFVEVMDVKPRHDVVAVHIPIGLPDVPAKGGRLCDREARRLLGWPRSGAISSPPVRSTLGAKTFERAYELNGGLSPVTWQLLKKVAEVEADFGPYLQRQIYEVHPELSFYELNDGVPMRHRKETVEGRAERRQLLIQKLPVVRAALETKVKAADEPRLLDACADLWTARRIAAKAAGRVPEDAPWDSKGLRMQIYR